MTPFALTLPQVAQGEALLFLEIIAWLYVPLSFLRVAGYTANRFLRGHLIDGRNSPLPLSVPPTMGWYFVLSVLVLLFLQSFLYLMVVVTGVSIFLMEGQRTALDQFGLEKLSAFELVKWSLLICGAVIFVEVPLSALMNLALTAIHVPHPEQEAVVDFRQFHTAAQVTSFLLQAVVLAPLIEELFFRGFLLTFLKNYTSTWLAIILSGGVFAFAHANLGSAIPLWFLGIALGVAYEHSGSLLLPMGVHACFNFATALSLMLDKNS